MSVPLRPRVKTRGRTALRRRWLCTTFAMVLMGLAASQAVSACDLCAVYTATELQQGRIGFRIGVAEQFTHFGTLQLDDRKVSNGGERLDSSITQLLLGYNFTERFGVQLNVPIISRKFRRFANGAFESGDETGFGDSTIVGMYSPQPLVSGDGLVRFTLMGGIKLPTGKTGRLREEVDENDGGAALDSHAATLSHSGITARPPVVAHHETGGPLTSGLHGHDLALGSGSVDGIVGFRFFANWKRLYATGSVQYFIRNQGRYNYQYANELLWRIGPGVFLALDDIGLERGYTLGLAALFTGETKGLDTLSGVKATDTGYTGLYLGPALTFTWGESLQAALAADLPVEQNNTSLQLVPDYRVRGALTWRF